MIGFKFCSFSKPNALSWLSSADAKLWELCSDEKAKYRSHGVLDYIGEKSCLLIVLGIILGGGSHTRNRYHRGKSTISR
ncbi:MAG: hypothetical protein QXV23_06660 [Candidatus Bathyarchaeia archaeon]